MSTPTSGFDRLPDELISKILSHLNSGNNTSGSLNSALRQLSLCSKRLWRIILPLLYHTVDFSKKEMIDALICTIKKSPNYINFIKVLRLDWSCHFIDAGSDMDQNGQSSPYVLLQSLSELETLSIRSGEGHQVHSFLDVDSRFYSCNLQLCKMMHSRLLSTKLTSFTMTRYGPGNYFDIYTLIPAFLLPSVTTIQGIRTRKDFHTSRSTDWIVPKGTTLELWYGTSNVETIELYDSRVDGGYIEQLLRLPRCLRKLAYEDIEDEELFILATQDSLQDALSYVSHTIEILDIRWRWDDIFEPPTTIWTFNSFKSLRKLAIAYSLLFGNIRKPDIGRVPPISSLLPLSLQVLGLYTAHFGKWMPQDYVDHVRKIILDKSLDTVPRLRVIAHVNNPLVLSPLIELAASCDITIAMGALDGGDCNVIDEPILEEENGERQSYLLAIKERGRS
ncbi:hypothetical protein CPB86DRAFT_872128 [Serendipita vermifera]|nr:hypothetical protein CPB86DRAFT_872128 [Serendipita vermifera]